MSISRARGDAVDAGAGRGSTPSSGGGRVLRRIEHEAADTSTATVR